MDLATEVLIVVNRSFYDKINIREHVCCCAEYAGLLIDGAANNIMLKKKIMF